MHDEVEYEEEFEEEPLLEGYEKLMEARKITYTDIKEHLTGPVISTITHIVLLAFLGTIIVFKAPEKAKEITVVMKEVEIQQIEPPPPPPEPPEPTPIENPTETPIERPNMEVDVDVQVENISVNNTSEVQLPSVLNMKMSNSALSLPVNPGGGGTKGSIGGKFLGTGGSGQRFAFVLDYSASMGGHDVGNKKIDVMEDHLVKALQGFKGRGQVCIILFAKGAWLLDGIWPCSNPNDKKRTYNQNDVLDLKPRWIVPGKNNLELLKKKIYETDTLFGTNWAPGMKIALEMKPQPDVIFFMTDGRVSETDAADTLKMVRAAKAKNKKLIVNTIAFGVTGDTGGSSSQKKKSSAKGSKARCDANYYLPEIAKITGGQFKGYSLEEIKAMADVKKITHYDTSVTSFDYSPPPKSKPLVKEKAVQGLVIE